ncbi:MAG: recombinase family protein [Clostridia bacterium]|nr:recombinase family protein [Clostridia bacterium]
MNDVTKTVEEVALYVRVSTEEQALNGDSLRTQREELTKYALNNGFHIFGIYEDDGYSATNLKRPALEKLLQDVQQNKINRILITKLDRLSRGVRNYYKILDILDDHEVYWQTIFEKYDSSTANGRLHINIMLSVAENESAQTGERIRSVFKTKIKNKELISGKIPVGLKRQEKKLVIDEDKKQIVIEAFNIHKETTSVYQTFQSLNLKYPELNLNYMRVYRLLTNKLYIGIKETKYGNIEDFCPAIIDRTAFENTQRLLKKNARKKSANNSGGYIFQGLLRCAECGYILGGKFYSKNIESSKYYYICKRHHLSLKCSCATNFNELKIEEKLLQEIKPQLDKYISDYDYKEKNFKKMDMTKEISSVENKLAKLKDLYVRDLIRIEDYEKDYREYLQQLTELHEQQKKIEINIPDNNLKALKSFLSNDFISEYNNFSRIQKRRIWLSIIDHVNIDKDYNMKIFFI